MTLKEVIDQMPRNEEWAESYVKFVPKFIEEAASGKDLSEWDRTVADEYLGKVSNCVSSLRTRYFSKEHRKLIKDNWSGLAPMLKRLADNQDEPDFELYKDIDEFITSLISANYPASIHRMVAGLQPNLLCTIVADKHLKCLFDLLAQYVPDSVEEYSGDWYRDSYNMQKAIRTQISENAGCRDLGTYAWLIKEYLENVTQIEDKSMEPTEKYVRLLEANYNMVLYGAPGTGKTFLARQIAEAMHAEVEMVQFHPSYDYTDFVEGLRPVMGNDGNLGFQRRDGVFKRFCKRAIEQSGTGHADNFEEAWGRLMAEFDTVDYIDVPLSKTAKRDSFRIELNEYGTGLASRTYENDEFRKGEWIKGRSMFFNYDQIYNVYRGLSGVPKGGFDNYRRHIVNMMKQRFGLKDYVAGNTEVDTGKKYVFIIDEINRGEISKIFGELFFSIDKGYREDKTVVDTQYQNLVPSDDVFAEGFRVPKNVYIIGTMNDIDRSVESIDFAMRRRFVWVEVAAEESAKRMPLNDEARKRMRQLNEAISSQDIGLNRSYHIGGAYFIGVDDFGQLWDMRLESLLREYLRGDMDEDKKIAILKQKYFE